MPFDPKYNLQSLERILNFFREDIAVQGKSHQPLRWVFETGSGKTSYPSDATDEEWPFVRPM
jgi:hypothetical protein